MMLPPKNSALKNFDHKRFAVFLLLATAVYFFVVQSWQARLHYPPSGLDPYAGIPLLPEPYEIPLYLLSYLLVPFLALALYSFWKYRFVKVLSVGIAVAAVGFVVHSLFKIELPDTSFIRNYLADRGIGHALWLLFTKRLYLIRLAFAGGMAVFLISYFFKKPNAEFWERFERAAIWRRILPVFFVALAILIFHPNFPTEEGFVNYGISPAHETLRGKPLLYETSTQYGILNTYLVAFTLKYFLPLSYKSFSFLLMIIYFAFYLLLYKSLREWMGSTALAVIGTWLGVVVGFLLLSDPNLTAYDFLGQTVYRQGFFIIPFFLLIRYMKKKDVLLQEVTLLSSAIGLFWSIDTGIYINIAVFGALAYTQKRWRDILILGLRQTAYILGVFGIINLANYFIYGAFPQWQLIINNLQSFSGGFGKIPMPRIGIYELYIFVYLAFLSWLALTWKKERADDGRIPVVFLAVYGAFSLLYYVGNSAWSYLNFTALPVLLLVLYAFRRWPRERVIGSIFAGVLIYSLIISVAKMPVVFAGRDYSNISLTAIDREDVSLYEDAQYIRQTFPETRLPIFHENLGKLLIMADKVNYFYVEYRGKPMSGFYDNWQILFHHQVAGFQNQLSRDWPPYVFVTRNTDERIEDFLSFVQDHYELRNSLKTLNIYERK